MTEDPIDDLDHSLCASAAERRLNAIEAALVEHQEPCSVRVLGRRYPAKFLVIVDYVDDDGERQLAAHFPETMEPYELLGMAEAVKVVVRG